MMDTERIMLPLINTGSSINNLSSLFNTKTLSGTNIGTIKLTGTGKQNFSLRTTLDALELIPELDELNKNRRVQTENFIKEMKSKRYYDNKRYYDKSIGSSVDLAKHSAHILRSQQWGNNSNVNNDNPQSFFSSILHPPKLGYKDIMREVGKLKTIILGYNIAKVKLPRSRLFSHTKVLSKEI
jgi:hypothetical protein